jgi:hypothetical protein
MNMPNRRKKKRISEPGKRHFVDVAVNRPEEAGEDRGRDHHPEAVSKVAIQR